MRIFAFDLTQIGQNVVVSDLFIYFPFTLINQREVEYKMKSDTHSLKLRYSAQFQATGINVSAGKECSIYYIMTEKEKKIGCYNCSPDLC